MSKRFNRLLLAPSLLRDLEFELPGDGSCMLRKVVQLMSWLDKHAVGTVARLLLTSGWGEESAEASIALGQLLAAIPALNSNAQLVEFAVEFSTPVSGEAVAAGLPRAPPAANLTAWLQRGSTRSTAVGVAACAPKHPLHIPHSCLPGVWPSP